MPFPMVHTRTSRSRCPCVAANPAATASASFSTQIGYSNFRAARPLRIASSTRAPFSCGRFGESSTTPPRIMPGMATPTAATPDPCGASAAIWSQIISQSESAGNSISASSRSNSSSVLSGKCCNAPEIRWPSISPATIRSVITTPTVFVIASPLVVSALKPRQPVDPVECRRLVALRQRRIIEHRVDEIIHHAAQHHHCLANVHQLRRALANDVHAQNLPRLAMKNQLQPSCRVASNLSPCNLAVICHAYFIRNILFRQLLLGLADKRNLRNRINPVGIKARVRLHPFVAEGALHRDPPLLHRNRRQAREPDHIPNSENMRNLGPKILIHRNPPARVSINPGRRQVQLVHITLPPYRVQQRVSRDALLALQVRHYRPVAQLFHALHFLMQPHGHAAVAQ